MEALEPYCKALSFEYRPFYLLGLNFTSTACRRGHLKPPCQVTLALTCHSIIGESFRAHATPFFWGMRTRCLHNGFSKRAGYLPRSAMYGCLGLCEYCQLAGLLHDILAHGGGGYLPRMQLRVWELQKETGIKLGAHGGQLEVT